MAGQAKYTGTAADVTYNSNTINIWEITNLPLALGTEDFAYSNCTVPLLSADGAVSDYIQLTNFGFTIPDDAQITGIIVNVYRYAANGFITDNSVKIMKGGTAVGTDQSVGAVWATTDEIGTLGSATNLWGTTWTAADIKDSGFGVQIQVVNTAWDSSVDAAFIDAVQISVAYFQEDGVKRIISRMREL